jgi:hypothetical protein
MSTLLDATSEIESELADNVNYAAKSTTTEITAEQATLNSEDLALSLKI